MQYDIDEIIENRIDDLDKDSSGTIVEQQWKRHLHALSIFWKSKGAPQNLTVA